MENRYNDLMVKFLNLNYPIRRLKRGRHFRRGISIEGINYYLGDETHSIPLYVGLIHNIREVFDCGEKESREAVATYLNLH